MYDAIIAVAKPDANYLAPVMQLKFQSSDSILTVVAAFGWHYSFLPPKNPLEAIPQQ